MCCTEENGDFEAIDHPEKKTNISWFLKDRELADPSVKDQIDMIYLTQNNWGGWAGMIADGKPIVNMQAIQFELENRQEFYDRVHSWMRINESGICSWRERKPFIPIWTI